MLDSSKMIEKNAMSVDEDCINLDLETLEKSIEKLDLEENKDNSGPITIDSSKLTEHLKGDGTSKDFISITNRTNMRDNNTSSLMNENEKAGAVAVSQQNVLRKV